MPSEDVLRDKRHRMFRNNHKLKSFLITFRFSFIMLPLKWLFRSFFFFFFFERPWACVIVGFQYCISSYRKKTYLYCFRVTRQFQLTPSVASNRKHCRVVCKYKLFDTNYSLILTIIVPFFIITPQSFLSQTNENNNPRLPIISAISDLLM